ncbi:glycosyltransferase family 4 protein [Candidatus Pacearchaeota archaeon]|nr:glycosyltransferase family 4 protein [Candidatus Pacearchaeota archaeon]
MKIAILHDYFDEIGGAEITLLYLAKEINAVIFTTNISRKLIHELGFKDIDIRSIGKVPNLRHIKQFFTQFRFQFAKLQGFDYYIFGGSNSIYAAKDNNHNLWYCFNPQMGLYNLRYIKKGITNILKQPLKSIQIGFDKRAVKKINKIISASRGVKKKVQKYYGRGSDVVYSPIDTNRFRWQKPKNYWLSVSRIDPCKNIELLIEAFKKVPNENLIFVGSASYEFKNYSKRLKMTSPPNVRFIGPISDRTKLSQMYSRCKGLITTSKIEGFGMTVVEAMASGKPVIAPNEGGYSETIIDEVTGKLIDDIDEEKLIEAINTIGKTPEKYIAVCLKQAKKFDVDIFIKKIKGIIQN